MKPNETYIMGRYEKIAWFNLAVVTSAVATYFLATLFLAGRMGIIGATAGAAASFALMGFIGFAPRLFSRQDTGWDTVPASPRGRHTVRFAVFGMIAVAIVIAIVRLITLLADIPESNSPMYAVAATLLIVLPVMIGGLVIMGVLFLLRPRNTRPSTEIIDRSTMRYGLFADTDMDERDRAIRQQAVRAGFGAFFGTYMALFASVFIGMLIEGREILTIDVQFMLVPLWLPLIVIVAVSSGATIIMYRRGVGHDET